MGFRFRKSFNLGKGFKVNTSKSGVGFSWGLPGFRLTKTATGQTRATLSIPGTGMSYVVNLGNGKLIKKVKGFLGKNNKEEVQEVPAEEAGEMTAQEAQKAIEEAQKAIEEAKKILEEEKNTKDA